jgi:putative phosphoesterase
MTRAERVAVLADVHGNATALEAVLAEVERERVDLVVGCGDLTWGPQPLETLALFDGLGVPVRHVRGNADRALVELADDPDRERTPREAWLVDAHGRSGRDALERFETTVTVDVAGLGTVLCSHGSPRSDEECVTVATPEARLREALDGDEAELVATAHTHMQYDRRVLGLRLFNPGSVGLPYEEERGAYWALLGPELELRRTPYDLDRAVAAYRATTDPSAEQMVELLLRPPSPAEVIEDAERRVFAG